MDASEFEHRYWTTSEFGHILKEEEELLANAPQPRGIGFSTRAQVSTDNESNAATRRQRTGFIVHLNILLTY